MYIDYIYLVLPKTPMLVFVTAVQSLKAIKILHLFLQYVLVLSFCFLNLNTLERFTSQCIRVLLVQFLVWYPWISIAQSISCQSRRSWIAHASFELSLITDMSESLRFFWCEV
jgi:hypothetical protein